LGSRENRWGAGATGRWFESREISIGSIEISPVNDRLDVRRSLTAGADETGRMKKDLTDGARFGIVGRTPCNLSMPLFPGSGKSIPGTAGIRHHARHLFRHLLDVEEVLVGDGNDDLSEQRNQAQ